MNGEVAQIIALVAHGNAALLPQAAPDLPETHQIFRFVEQIGFLRPPSRGSAGDDRVVARSGTEWFHLLRAERVSRLMLVPLTDWSAPTQPPAQFAAAFAGGSQTGIVAFHPGDTTEIWRARWDVTGAGNTDQRIWSVAYQGVAGPPPAEVPAGPGVEEATTALCASLIAIGAFAEAQQQLHWARLFASSLALLSLDHALPSYDNVLLPAVGYDRPARHLLAAATSAWVFGGMGSWNDYSPMDDGENLVYETVSAAHYQAVVVALAAVANAFHPTP